MTGPTLRLSKAAHERLLELCTAALPAQSFGLISGREPGLAEEVHPMARNLRQANTLISRFFESYGEFYRRPDRGFCFDPEELAEVEERIRRAGRQVVAVYHSHRWLQARPTDVDIDLHYSPDVLQAIVSVVDPASPRVGVFRIRDGAYAEAAVEVLA